MLKPWNVLNDALKTLTIRQLLGDGVSRTNPHESTILKLLKTHHAITGKLEDALAELADHHARSKPAKADKPAGA